MQWLLYSKYTVFTHFCCYESAQSQVSATPLFLLLGTNNSVGTEDVIQLETILDVKKVALLNFVI